MYGHCAANVRIPLTGSNNFEAAKIMGGYEGDDRINVKSTNKVYAFCQVDEQINQEVCNDTKIGESRWSSFPDMKSSLYGFKGFGHTYCAQFNNDDLCDGLCLMASELKKSCDCEWMDSIDGNPLNITRDSFQHGIGGMTNLNNVPTLFLPMHDGNGNQWMEILEFMHKDENGDSVDQWVQREVLDSHRESFSTISVPFEFLCSDAVPQSSTTHQTTDSWSSTSENNAIQISSNFVVKILVIHLFLLIISLLI